MSKWKVVVPIILIAAGAVSLYLFVRFKKMQPRREIHYEGPLVSVQEVHLRKRPVMIEGYGTVKPRHTLDLVPQVSGKVVMISKNFINGGFVKKGQVLIQIERADYEIALKRAEANLLNTEVSYKKALKQAHIAKKEWEEILRSVLVNKKVMPDELTLYLPQLKAAKAAYDSAVSDVRLAKLNLERTTLISPYDARVLTRKTDIGQYVTPGKALGSLFGIAEADIVVPLHTQDVAWLKISSDAEVISNLTGKVIRYPGRLIRTEGRIDPASRMLHAVIEVKRPYGFTPPLENGAFVIVKIIGKKAEGFWVPTKAERDGKVWVAQESHLRIRNVRILYRKTDTVLVSGLRDGDHIITTSLFAVTDGMKIRVPESDKK